jgi:hypothetical protein
MLYLHVAYARHQAILYSSTAGLLPIYLFYFVIRLFKPYRVLSTYPREAMSRQLRVDNLEYQ